MRKLFSIERRNQEKMASHAKDCSDGAVPQRQCIVPQVYENNGQIE